MSKKIIFVIVLFTVSICFVSAAQSHDENNIKWTNWSESIFKQAKKENKFIILDLEAVWCHWCHVMHKETYNDPSVVKLINSYFIPVRVDQDSRPDLSNRYRDYGWPATIVFNSNGEEIIKRAGYIQPEVMKEELQSIIDDPTPEEEQQDDLNILFSGAQELTDELRQELKESHLLAYDFKQGGLKLFQKFLDSDSIEYSLLEAKAGSKVHEKIAIQTLDAAIKLIDPVWGGAYQYSTMSSWDYPHFEKLLTMQARFMRIYSKAYNQFKNPNYLKVAIDVHKYLKSFLTSTDGVFYVSQDADLIQGEHGSDYFKQNDSGRRKLGIPRIDKHIYSSQNGLVIDALVEMYLATGDKKYLEEATGAAEWILKKRSFGTGFIDSLYWIFSDWSEPKNMLTSIKWIFTNFTMPVKGFKHDENNSAGPFLADTLNMGRAFINLYNATKEKKWLTYAEQAGKFIDKHFTSPVVGFSTSESSCKICAVRNPSRLTDENIETARFTNKLFKITQNTKYKEMSEHALRYLATPEIALMTLTEPGILIVDMEINSKSTGKN